MSFLPFRVAAETVSHPPPFPSFRARHDARDGIILPSRNIADLLDFPVLGRD
jgi:hypothetical protein